MKLYLHIRAKEKEQLQPIFYNFRAIFAFRNNEILLAKNPIYFNKTYSLYKSSFYHHIFTIPDLTYCIKLGWIN